MTTIVTLWTIVFVAVVVYTVIQIAGVRSLRSRAEANRYWESRLNNNDLTFLEP